MASYGDIVNVRAFAPDGTLVGWNATAEVIVEAPTPPATPPPTPEPISADFIGVPTAGCAPLIVDFSDLSTGNPTSWFWDFGNDLTNATRTPSVEYTYPGLYTVSLTASNSVGSDTETKNDYIDVGEPPAAGFAYTGDPPGLVSFTDASANSPASWLWDFGDGSTISTQQNPTHLYANAGVYTVTLTVTNKCGSSTTSREIGLPA
jgi:PKD repeat protein